MVNIFYPRSHNPTECSGFVQNVPFTSSANNSDHHISPSTHRVQTYCICGNRGSGKFVECRSEEKCKSSRFFHMSCVGFLDSSNPTKQKSFICQECDKHLFDSKAKRVRYNVDPSNILYASEIDTSSEFHHLVPTNRHRSSLYTHLFQNKRNQYFNNPPRLPYYHSSTDTAVTTASVSTTIKPQSHAPPLFLSQFTLPKSKSPSAL